MSGTNGMNLLICIPASDWWIQICRAIIRHISGSGVGGGREMVMSLRYERGSNEVFRRDLHPTSKCTGMNVLVPSVDGRGGGDSGSLAVQEPKQET
jgi:hypothetical protein